MQSQQPHMLARALTSLAGLPRLLPLGFLLCKQDLTERFAGSLLGTCWVFIWPLVQLFIYIIIFGKFMGARLGIAGDTHVYSYGIYVAAGLLPWTCFANTLSRTCRVFVEKRPIINKVAVDLRVFPIAIAIAECLPFAAGIFLLSLINLLMGWSPSPGLLAATILCFLAQMTLALGLGLFLATIATFIRDTIEAVGVVLQMAFWFTPIVYHPSLLPTWVQHALILNPMTHVTQIFQQCFVFGGHVPIFSVLLLPIIGVAALLLGLATLTSLEKDVRDVL